MLTCGVDIGARTIDIVLYDGAQILESLVVDTGSRPRDNAEAAFARLLRAADVAPTDLTRTVATGYGRNHFASAHAAASEIMCHAAGVVYFFPTIETIVDIGGQDSKVIRVAPSGRVLDFTMNDRCAAGTGRFIELTAQTLGVSLEEAGALAASSPIAAEITSMCAVFAESEIVGLLQNDVPLAQILHGVCRSVARRTVALMGSRHPSKSLVLTGGVARNIGVVRALRDETGAEVHVPPNPQLTGALGAAILAATQAAATPQPQR